MPRLLTRLLTVLPLLAVLAGCDLAEERFEPQVVVSATLTAGLELGRVAVQLSQTAPIDVAFDSTFGLAGASVKLVLLAPDGSAERSFPLTEKAKRRGQYRAIPGGSVRVEPNRRYRLVATFPEGSDGASLLAFGDSVWAETTVPDPFTVVRTPGDTVVYDVTAPSPAIDVRTNSAPGRQNIFIFNIRSLTSPPDGSLLTPLAASFVEDGDLDLGDLVSTSSPLLNEANYERNADGTLRLRVPWFAISFFGPTAFTANAVDDALYDFLRSRDAQFNPTTLSPGEIQRIFSNVENGVGVFGSIAQSDTVRVTVCPTAQTCPPAP